jgi:hypothetical protein
MFTLKRYLEEAKPSGKNLHLEHLEDLMFLEGTAGVTRSIAFMKSLLEMFSDSGKDTSYDGANAPITRNIPTIKFDGAPAIFAGTDPSNNRFFVGTKGVFAQNAKVCYDESDVDQYFSNSPGLANKLKLALKHLPDLQIKGVIQGDFLFSHEDKKIETIDGKRYITFRPNTITYAIPTDSDLARQITRAKIGIVFHTVYTGKTLPQMTASFGAFDASKLKSSADVWVRDPYFSNVSGIATFSDAETKNVAAIIKKIEALGAQLDKRVMNKIASNDFLRTRIMAWNNLKVREGVGITNIPQHIQGFIVDMDGRLNADILAAKREDTKKKRLIEKTTVMSFWKDKRTLASLNTAYQIYNLITQIKLIYVRKLDQIQDMIGTFVKTASGYKVTGHEGFVASIDGQGAVKLLDRLEFSRLNFTLPKNWDR